VKTTLELPDPLLRKAKAMAAERGESLKDFITEALVAHIARKSGGQREAAAPAWMKHYGGLAHIAGDVRRMQQDIDDTLGVVNTEDWK
jgi:hypothetical protein